ncbi:MAG: hypothetical protein JW776_05505 [Candidatus Lokiarchaeota archaeon]|nr:hypothetical protein [Candidatus Lokiarchaeota archaeon]
MDSEEPQQILDMNPMEFKKFLNEVEKQLPYALENKDYVWYEENWICEKFGTENPISQQFCVEYREENNFFRYDSFSAFLKKDS